MVIATIQLELRVNGASIIRNVVSGFDLSEGFDYRKESLPIVLLEIGEGSKIRSHGAIRSCGRAVGLQMERSRRTGSNA